MSLTFYFDEDFASGAHARVLRQSGYDAIRPHDVGMLRKTDEEQLAFATSAGRLLVSYNRKDFQRIHGEWMGAARAHAGVLLVHKVSDYSPGEFLRRIEAVNSARGDLSTADEILFLSNFG